MQEKIDKESRCVYSDAWKGYIPIHTGHVNMAIVVENKRLKAAIDARKTEHNFRETAGYARTSEETLTKIYDGSSSVQLSKLGTVAERFGLDVVVTFKPKQRAANVAQEAAA